MQNNNDKLHRGIDNQLCPVCSSLYFLSVSFSPCTQYCNFSEQISQQLFKIEGLCFVYPLTMTCYIGGLRTGIFLFMLHCIRPSFFLSTFLSKISPQLYKIESSYLVNRITATSCIVGQRTSFLLFVLICIYSLFSSLCIQYCKYL